MDPGSDEADAALLAVAWSGPWPAAHPVVGATVDRVLERLSSGPLLHRYSDRVADERAGPDLPDLEASLLGVRALARLGRWEEAHERMEGIAGLVAGAGPGLLSETADPLSGELYGNFPSTAAGLALVEAALALDAGPR
jgi:GH15 family glucan-1,4-alpha-glucosidase